MLGAVMLMLALEDAAGPRMPDFGQADRSELIACIPAGARAYPSFEAAPAALRLEFISCTMRLTSRLMNRQLPARIGSETIFVSTTAIGPMLRYDYRIERPGAQIDAAERADFASGTRQRVCAAPLMRATIGRGGAYRYVWADRDGVVFQQLTVTRCP